MANEIPIEFRKDGVLVNGYSSIVAAVIGSNISRTTILKMLRKNVVIQGFTANYSNKNKNKKENI